MIYEIAEITIQPDAHSAFEAAVDQAVSIFKAAKGCVSMRLDRGIESGNTYHLVVGWATLENHTVDFRGSQGFQDWRALVGQYFAQPPKVEHFSTVVAGF
ncbi:antibiotic biosynthesis monooxygenase family protein [Duganella callida]|uniref:Antibiotic biosynthesis monooxygenase n=1 Tax=Duganella callida TaxID=2561932 RepID=A0A4Y9SFS8_9BURK|nr:antibiotic biosynthesis monooxygenase family protein [Duganella callida]TFW18850.1 antibiotic biosynthesis monooxygenase [Duganella callida]